MTVRPRTALIGAAATAAALLVVPPSLSASEAGEEPRACGQGSWVAGTVDLCAGELVHRDYVYDDHGAAATTAIPQEGEGLYAAIRPTHDGWGNISPTGVADYSADPDSRDNAADLVALRMRVTGDELTITAELNTLVDPQVARVVVGIDTDNDPATQDGDVWPDGLLAGPISGEPLRNTGLDVFVPLTGGDPRTNLLTATVDRPAGATWRVQAVVARSMPTAGGPVVMNVAFRGVDERGGWWENAQAAALAANDIAAFGHTVDLADLDNSVTRVAEVPKGKLRQRVYISGHNPGAGEGIDHDGVPGPATRDPSERSISSQGFTHIGRYQPYGFYQPAQDGPHELQLLLHGAGENHSTQMWDPASGANPPPVAVAFGDSNRIFASPLGRGPRGWYSSYSERDVLDVLADVKAHYPVLADRVVASGTSMGGYGAMRIAALHPDEFAAVVDWVGFTGNSFNGTGLEGTVDGSIGAHGNVVDLLGNLRHVPLGAWYAGADELVHVNQAIAVRDRLAELGLPSAWWLHPAANHSSPATINDWVKEAAWSEGRVRVQDPGRVSYRTDAAFTDDPAGVRPDSAYWVSGIVPAESGPAQVEAFSHGCGSGEPAAEVSTGYGEQPVPWTGQFIDATPTVVPNARRLELSLTNVGALTVDTGKRKAPAGSRGACLGRKPFTYHVVTDAPVVIEFSDGRAIDLPAGTHTGRI